MARSSWGRAFRLVRTRDISDAIEESKQTTDIEVRQACIGSRTAFEGNGMANRKNYLTHWKHPRQPGLGTISQPHYS